MGIFRRRDSPHWWYPIQPQTVEVYKADRLGAVKQATINRELALLKVIFSNYCVTAATIPST